MVLDEREAAAAQSQAQESSESSDEDDATSVLAKSFVMVPPQDPVEASMENLSAPVTDGTRIESPTPSKDESGLASKLDVLSLTASQDLEDVVGRDFEFQTVIPTMQQVYGCTISEGNISENDFELYKRFSLLSFQPSAEEIGEFLFCNVVFVWTCNCWHSYE